MALDRAQYDLLGYEWIPRCRDCGYDLASVQGPICPECGAERARSGSSPVITLRTIKRFYRLCVWQYLVPLGFVGITTVLMVLTTTIPHSPLWGIAGPLIILMGVALLWPIGAFLMLGPVLIHDILRSPLESKARHIASLIAVGIVGPVFAEIVAMVIALRILDTTGM